MMGRCIGFHQAKWCLHIGHAKAICISFGLAEEYGGLTNLRFDDTNPIKEDVEYVDAIRGM